MKRSEMNVRLTDLLCAFGWQLCVLFAGCSCLAMSGLASISGPTHRNGRCILGDSTIEAFCKDSATAMQAHNYGIGRLFGYDAQEFMGKQYK